MRELTEELSEESAAVVIAGYRHILETNAESNRGNYKYDIYESVLNNSDFEKVANSAVNEGIGKIIGFKELLTLKYIFELEQVIEKYVRER